MVAMNIARFSSHRLLARCLTLVGLLAGFELAQAQPLLTSSVPATGATGVSTTTTVVFNFSEAMDPDATDATFIDLSNPLSPISTSASWNPANTVLTCTLSHPFQPTKPSPGW